MGYIHFCQYEIFAIKATLINNKKINDTFDHNFKNIHLCIMSYVSFERQYFILYNGALTLKMSKKAFNPFCGEPLQIHV